MGLKLQSVSGGSVELNAPVTATNYTVAMPAQSGTMMMAENYQPPPFNNLLINGAMEVCQRSGITGPLSAGSVIYAGPDRWYTSIGTGTTTISFTQQPSGVSNWNNVLRIQRSLGQTNTGAIIVGQQIESKNVVPIQGKTVTFSAYIRAGVNFSAVGKLLTIAPSFGTGIDQSSLGGINGTWTGWSNMATSVTLTTTLQRFSHTFTVPASATEMQINLSYAPTGTAGAEDVVEITGAQLEEGSTATRFSRRGFGEELQLCQRYFETSYPYGSIIGAANDGSNAIVNVAINGSDFYSFGLIRFKVQKRSIPTLTAYNPITGTAGGYRGYSDNSNNAAITAFRYTNDSGTYIWTSSLNMTTGLVYGIHYTASSEL